MSYDLTSIEAFNPPQRKARHWTRILTMYMNRCTQDEYGNLYGDCYSAWDSWIRWVVLGVIIALFLLLFMSCSCLSARRRRRQGLQPRYGTGWTQRQWPYYNQAYSGPAPPYGVQDPHGPPPYQQTGIELQPPMNSYQPQRETDYMYDPSVGPPPGKKGESTIIR